MEGRKNKSWLLVLCIIVAIFVIFPKLTYGQMTFFKPLGGKVFPRWDTFCLGLDFAFDVEKTDGTTDGPFAITPLTDRNRWYTIAGIPGKNILLTSARFQLPLCVTPCQNGLCPVSAYPVQTFGVSIIPSF